MNRPAQFAWDMIEAAQGATSLPELSAVAARYTRRVGFNHYGFASRANARGEAKAADYRYFHNIPEPYGRHRYEGIYPSANANRDVLVAHLRAGLPTTAFSDKGIVTHTRPDILRRSSRTLDRASDNGVKSGVVVPLGITPTSWSFMVMTMQDDCELRDVLQAMPNFHFFAHHVHCVARNLLQRDVPKVALSVREREVLCWAAVGKTSWEIGRILSISERTVNFHLQGAAQKLQVSGRLAACAKALTLALIAI